MTDAMLVQEYAQSRSPRVLAELVSRHTDWVYSAALRMVGDADLAQDVTQAVFLVLVRKAATLERKPVNAWLFGVTRFAAKHALRDRARRRRHERLAAMMIGQTNKTQNRQTWQAVAPLLDELVGCLNPSDRRAVLLRFYQGKSMAQVGEALDVSEDAAKKRVAKAVKRLRELLDGRGIKVPADALGVALLDHTTHAAPAKLAATCATPASSAPRTALSIANGAITMMAMAKMKLAALVLIAIGLVPAAMALALQVSGTPASQPAAAILQSTSGPAVDAADLYAKAFAAITIDCPAASAVVYPEYGPDSADWQRVAAAAWKADAHVRELAHQARFIDTVQWPSVNLTTPPAYGKSPFIAYYNGLRNLANHLGDSAEYAYSQGNSAQAIELLRDELHMSNLLMNSANHSLLRVLVGVGVDALAMSRLEIIATGVVLTDDPNNTRDLQIRTANDLIAQLLDQTNPVIRLRQLDLDLKTPMGTQPNIGKAVETLRRVNAEQTLAAMSLACHLFKFDTGRWPNSLDELIPTYLPHAMIDPWGDGKQTIGYVLIKGGLPDGSDRPLVYTRCNSQDGLLYLANSYAYGFYFGDDSDKPASQQKQGGQFRDVTHWQPRPNYTGPATLPLPPQAAHQTGMRILPTDLARANPGAD